MSTKKEHEALAEEHLSSAKSVFGLARGHTLAPGKCWTGFGFIMDAREDIRRAQEEARHLRNPTPKQKRLKKEINHTAGRIFNLTKAYKDRCVK